MTLKGMPKFYLLNDVEEQKNPVVRALVQTPGVLSYKDMDLPDFEYTEKAIQDAMAGLVGYDVEDEMHNGTGDRSFATVKNAGYCPEYGGYVDLEVWKPEYHDLVRNMARNIDEGIPIKRGFSTEVDVYNATRLSDRVRIDKMGYHGLIMTKQPRDKHTGVCSVLPNSYDEETIFGDDLKMTEELKALQEKYDALQSRYDTLFKDHEAGKTAYTEGVAAYKKGKELYAEAREQITSLEAELAPIREAAETERLEVLNKIVEAAPDEDKDTIRATLENKSIEELGVFAKLQNKPAKGVVTQKPPQKKDDEDEITVDDVWKMLGRD